MNGASGNPSLDARRRPKPTRSLVLLWLGLTVAWLATLAAVIPGDSDKPKAKRPSIYLKVYASPILAIQRAGQPGAAVEIRAEIVGELTEAWYCPEVTFIWPDSTVSKQESDCVVWEDAYLEGAKPEMRWKQGRVFPPGDWPVTVELKKAGRLVARQTAYARVAE